MFTKKSFFNYTFYIAGMFLFAFSFISLTLSVLPNIASAAESFPASLVSYWRLDETSGTTATDSKDGNQGTLVNGPIWTAGKVGNGLRFDGVDDGVLYNQPFIFNQQTDATIEFWINKSTISHRAVIWGRGDDFWSNRFHIYVGGVSAVGGLGVDYFSPSGVLHSVLSYDNVPANQWVHVAITRSTNTYRLYVNGQFATERIDTNPDLPNTTSWYLARRGGFAYDGLIDEVAIYNAALSVSDIATHYNNSLAGRSYFDSTPDTTAPVISAITATQIQGDKATITWTTNELSTSQVEYGTTTAYGSQTTLDTNYVTSHSVTLTGLIPNTLYHYRVKSKDHSNNEAISLDNTFTTTNEILPTSLVSYWRFDETSGTTATDSKDGNQGTLVNGPIWTAGKVGNGLSFDGVDDYVTIPHNTNLNIGSAFSLKLWFKANTVQPSSDGFWALVDKSHGGLPQFNSDPGSGWNLQGSPDGSVFFVVGTGTSFPILGSTGVNVRDGLWHNIGLTWDGATAKMYLDGALKSTTAFSGPILNNSRPLAFGRIANANLRQFSGFIDEVAIYNTALSASDITIHYYNGVAGKSYYEAPDTTAPSAITNLSVSDKTSNSITLSWTAPGNDGNVGTAVSYDIRYSTSPITETNWASATQAAGEPAPQVAGTNQTFTVSGLSSSTTYYFAIKSSDGINISGLSNVINASTYAAGTTIICSNTTLNASTYTYTDLIVSCGATLTLKGDPAKVGFKGVEINANNIIVDQGARITADGQGYQSDRVANWLYNVGPGGGGENRMSVNAGGGGHGGFGGYGNINSSYPQGVPGGNPYGSAITPIELGSPGGDSYNNLRGTMVGGPGGGAIKLNIPGTLTLDGEISANGSIPTDVTHTEAGGGSGGSIYITTNNFAGSGLISVNGATGSAGPSAGGGAGGRIAIYYASKTFTGTITAYGNTGSQTGGAGTIYTKSSSTASGDLLIDNNASYGAKTPLTSETFNDIKIQRGSRSYVDSGINTSANTMLLSGDDQFYNQGTLGVSQTLTITASKFYERGTLNINDVSVENGSYVEFQDNNPTTPQNVNNLTVKGNSTIGHKINSTSLIPVYTLNLNVAGNMNLELGSKISADDLGYQPDRVANWLYNVGPGGGQDSGSSRGAGGAGHNGKGGDGNPYGAAGLGGLLYGNAAAPIDPGSAGGDSYDWSRGTIIGGPGGGAVQLGIAKTLTLNGIISSNGGISLNAPDWPIGGGGSGGSIYVTAGTFAGSGTVRTNGGNSLGGGGACGRIAIYYNTNTFSGTIENQPGTGGYRSGQCIDPPLLKTIVTDSTPPITTISVSGTQSLNNWYTSDVMVTLSATDADSGVKETKYRVNGGAWQTYNTPFSLSYEGQRTIEYYSVDNVGNIEATKTEIVKIDKTAPSTTDNAPTGWQSSDVTITFASQDAISGVDKLFACADQTNTCVPQVSTGVIVAQEGTNYVRYYAQDIAGNQEAIHSVQVQIDKTVPAPQPPQVQGTQGQNNWYTSGAGITLSASDAGSGMSEILYGFTSGGPYTKYTAPIVISQEGKTIIYWTCKDLAQNTCPEQAITVQVDKTAPEGTASVSSGTQGQNNWYTFDAGITLTTSDAISGIQKVEYSFDNQTWSVYTTPFNVTQEGATTIYARVYDMAGHLKTFTLTIKIDKTSGTTAAQAPAGWINTDGTVALSSQDATSGVKITEYSFDQTTWTTYTVPIIINQLGTTIIYYRCQDNAGNVETTKQVQVKIDKAAPVSTISLAGTLGQNNWYASDVTATITATDDYSGIKEIKYRVDAGTWTTYTSSLVIGEGQHTIEYYALDNAGNTELTKSTQFKADKTAPATTHFVSGTFEPAPYSDWYKGAPIITLASQDTLSGVKTTNYCVDTTNTCSPTNVYSAPFAADNLGTNYIRYYSTDNAGNQEAIHSFSIKVDKDPDSDGVFNNFDQCDDVYGTVAGTGCPAVDKTTVWLHVINLGREKEDIEYERKIKEEDSDSDKDDDDNESNERSEATEQSLASVKDFFKRLFGKKVTKQPLAGIEVRVFDRNNPDFQALVKSLMPKKEHDDDNDEDKDKSKKYKNPKGKFYNEIYEAKKGMIASCVTDSQGICYAGEPKVGDYLVIAKWQDTETGYTIYTGRPKSPEDFKAGLAEKKLKITKVLRKGVFLEYRGGSKTVIITPAGVELPWPPKKEKEEKKEKKGKKSSLWLAVKEELGDQATDIVITRVAKKIAEANDIAVPEWGLINGKHDARALSADMLDKISELIEAFRNR